MSRTRRSIQILKNNWHFKRNRRADFVAQCQDNDPELMGFKPKPQELVSSWNDKYPAALHEVKYLSQTK
jgi:hypothetical protein